MKEVRSFYEDGEGKLWIGTYDGGLFCFHNKKLTSINALPNCKLNDDVFTLAKDDQDNIYMTSNTGLWMVNERKLDAFFKGKIPYLVPFFYGNETGILNTEFNGGFQNNFLKTKYGHFYFPTIEGILIATPEELNFRKLKPQISSVRLDRISKSGNYIQVERDVKVIEFLFHCPNFLSKYNVHYQFSLSKPGMPKKWESLEKEAKVRFTLLPPGEYIFSLRAIDGFNDDNPHVEELRFTILPYFYETNWFKTLVALIIALLILGIIRIRINYVKRSVINKNKVNNQLLAFKLQAVQAKMNPHFIFNSLNNINYLLTVEKNLRDRIRTLKALNKENGYGIPLFKAEEEVNWTFRDLKTIYDAYISSDTGSGYLGINVTPGNWIDHSALTRPINVRLFNEIVCSEQYKKMFDFCIPLRYFASLSAIYTTKAFTNSIGSAIDWNGYKRVVDTVVSKKETDVLLPFYESVRKVFYYSYNSFNASYDGEGDDEFNELAEQERISRLSRPFTNIDQDGIIRISDIQYDILKANQVDPLIREGMGPLRDIIGSGYEGRIVSDPTNACGAARNSNSCD